MKFRLANIYDLPLIMSYLCQAEYKHTMLASQFYRAGLAQWPTKSLIAIDLQNNTVQSVYLVNTEGYIYISQKYFEPNSIKLFINRATMFTDIYCFIGSSAVVDFIQKRLQYPFRLRSDFFIMASTSYLPKLHLMPNFRVAHSTYADFDILSDLNLEYQEEEVFARALTSERKLSLMNFYKEKLKEEINVHGLYHNKPVALAALNSESFQHFQLGGVFTHKQYRRLGFSTALITVLLHYAATKHKNISLFVKQSNDAATTLYQKLGFVLHDKMSILYVKD
jgi:ribosomal protein S18 acetylase RimI-like enzyme